MHIKTEVTTLTQYCHSQITPAWVEKVVKLGGSFPENFGNWRELLKTGGKSAVFACEKI